MRAPKLQNGFMTKKKLRKKYNFLSISDFNRILNECERKHPDEVIVHWANGHQVALSPKLIEVMDDMVEIRIESAIQKSRKRYLDYIKDVFGGEIKISPSGELYVDPEEFINNL